MGKENKSTGLDGEVNMLIEIALDLDIIYLWKMKAIKKIETKLNQLSPGSIEELNRYLDYLINKKTKQQPRKLKQDWAGGLKDIPYSATELQKKALDWRQK